MYSSTSMLCNQYFRHYYQKKKKRTGKEEELIISAILIGRYVVVKFNGVYMV